MTRPSWPLSRDAVEAPPLRKEVQEAIEAVGTAIDTTYAVLGFDLRRMIEHDSPDYNQTVRDAYDSVCRARAAMLAAVRTEAAE